MCLLIIPICIIIFYFSYKGFKKADLEFFEKRKKFIFYLDNIKDFETLKRIGEINMFGEREKWYPRYTNVIPYLEKKIEETDDKTYEAYLEDYSKFIKGYLCTMPFMVLSIVVSVSCIIYLFRNFS